MGFNAVFKGLKEKFLPRELNRLSVIGRDSKTSSSLCWRKVQKKQINKLPLKTDLAVLRKLSNIRFE